MISIKIKFKQVMSKESCLIIAFAFLFFIVALPVYGQTLEVGVYGSGVYEDTITIEQGTPLELRWLFPPSFLRCRFQGAFGWAFSRSGTFPVTAWVNKTYQITCCDRFVSNWCTGNQVSDSTTINVVSPPAGNQIYWDFSECDSETICKGTFTAGEAGYTQNNARAVYDKLWPGSVLVPGWVDAMNGWVGLIYDDGRDIGIIQIVSLDGYWRRGILFSDEEGNQILTTANGIWGDNSFLNCSPDAPSGDNQLVWSCESTPSTSPLACGFDFPFVTNNGAINSPYSLVSRRTTCDLWGGIFGSSYNGFSIINSGKWWNNLSDGVPGWLLTDFESFFYAIRQDGVWMGPGSIQSGPWSLQLATHYACTESNTCQLTSGPGPDTCSSDADCGPPLPTLELFAQANPASGQPPLAVSVEAWTEGTALGNINYKFDCTDNGSWDHEFTLVLDPLDPDQGTRYNTADGGFFCNYSASGMYTIRVRAERSGLTTDILVSVDVVGDPPSANNLRSTQPDYCVVTWPAAILSWNFTDPDAGDTQSAYRVQMDNNSNFSSPEIDTGKVISSSNSYATAANVLSWSVRYYWRLMVWDSADVSSGWIRAPSSLRTPLHRYPDVDFSWDPQMPAAEEQVQFTDSSEVFGGASKSLLWTFQDGDPRTSTQENPVVTFSSSANKLVTLRVRDSNGFTCTESQIINIQLPLPDWKEIPPF